MTVLDAAYHEVAVTNSKLRDEVERLRAALEELKDELIAHGYAPEGFYIELIDRALKEGGDGSK